MGAVMTNLKLWNSADIDNVASGLIKPEDVRKQEVEAMVDTGATTVVIPIGVPSGLRKWSWLMAASGR